jgi:sRNA-binding protein
MPAPKKMSPEKFAQLQKTIDVLNEHFPKAFPKKGGLPVKPLALHITKQIMPKVKELNLDVTWSQLRTALAYWCSRAYYLKTFKTSTHRIDINGDVAGALTPEHQKYAKERFQRLFKRSETKNHEAPTSLQDANSINDENQAAEMADYNAAVDAEFAGVTESKEAC